MFDEHQKEIARFAQFDADNMARVITFVYATVQQSLHMTPMIMGAIDEQGVDSEYLWGWKKDAYAFIEENKADVYRVAMAIYGGYADPDICQHELLKYFASLPGLGLVKGGFVIQLCFGLSGCLDTHNIKRFGLKGNTFNANRFKGAKTEATRNRVVRHYHALIKKSGGTRALWDRWCEHVAEKQPKQYANAWQVSRVHCAALGLV